MIDYKNENEYKKSVRDGLRAVGFSVQFHEDKFSSFIPDISIAGLGADGWVEVKYAHKVPGCLGDIRHFTMGQERWLRERGLMGSGHCYLLLGTPTGHFLFPWTLFPDARHSGLAGVPGYPTISSVCAVLASRFRQRP